jgi:hypothetical protein
MLAVDCFAALLAFPFTIVTVVYVAETTAAAIN